MHYLSAAQRADLERLWRELGAAYPMASPPETDDEVVAAALDAWIAGVLSSEGRFSSASLRDLAELIKESEPEGRVTALAERTLTVVRPAT